MIKQVHCDATIAFPLVVAETFATRGKPCWSMSKSEYVFIPFYLSAHILLIIWGKNFTLILSANLQIWFDFHVCYEPPPSTSIDMPYREITVDGVLTSHMLRSNNFLFILGKQKNDKHINLIFRVFQMFSLYFFGNLMCKIYVSYQDFEILRGLNTRLQIV